MDKWDELTGRIQNALLAEEPEAAISAGFQLICEFGRTFEQLGADLDRIATTLENSNVISGEDDAGIPPELRHDEDPPEHDL